MPVLSLSHLTLLIRSLPRLYKSGNFLHHEYDFHSLPCSPQPSLSVPSFFNLIISQLRPHIASDST
jgi:hypothetical protein